jgi:hypothetical protein
MLRDLDALLQAFEGSATGTGTTFIKVRIPSQGRALGKGAQKSIEDVRANIAAGGGSELVNAEREEGR